MEIKMKIYPVCQLAFAIMLTSVANATTYYVATTGNNANSCLQSQNISTPKQTIAAGIACLSSGDTLYIRQGTYSERIDVVDYHIPSGTSWSSSITIAGYPGERAILKAINIQQNTDLSVPSYLVFNNLTVDASGSPSQATQTQTPFRVAGTVH